MVRALFLISFLFSTGLAEAGVSRAERGLLMIANLSDRRTGIKEQLYLREERFAVESTERLLGKAYGRRILLTPNEATEENFLRSLEELELDADLQAIDVVTYLHGRDGKICFRDQFPDHCEDLSKLAEKIRALEGSRGGAPAKLRMLYSDACFGASHMTQWMSAGFRVVNGSIDQDANWNLDMKQFFRAWRKGRTYGDSVRRANRVWVTPIMDRIIHGDSRKLTNGDLSITIQTPVL